VLAILAVWLLLAGSHGSSWRIGNGRMEWKYESVPGFFAQDDEGTDALSYDYVGLTVLPSHHRRLASKCPDAYLTI